MRRSGVITETARTGPSSSTDWTDPNNRSDNGRRPRNERPAAPCRPRRLDAAAFVAVAADTDRHPTVKSQFRRRLPVPPTAAPFPFLPPPPPSPYFIFLVCQRYTRRWRRRKRSSVQSSTGRFRIRRDRSIRSALAHTKRGPVINGSFMSFRYFHQMKGLKYESNSRRLGRIHIKNEAIPGKPIRYVRE